MKNQKLCQISHALPSYFLELPNGTEITSAQLIQKGGLDPNTLDEEDLLEFHEVCFVAAKACGVTLDMSKHAFRLEGLPWNLEFVIRK